MHWYHLISCASMTWNNQPSSQQMHLHTESGLSYSRCKTITLVDQSAMHPAPFRCRKKDMWLLGRRLLQALGLARNSQTMFKAYSSHWEWTTSKPLVPFLSTKDLSKMPPQVLRFRLRLLRFIPIMVHIPDQQIADHQCPVLWFSQ